MAAVMKLRYRSYVKCKNCGFNIELLFECRFEYPFIFTVMCPNCKRSDLYHRIELIQENDKYCEEMNKKVEEAVKPLRTAVMLSQFANMIYPTLQILTELPLKLRIHTHSTNT
jgi:ribosomal protein L32